MYSERVGWRLQWVDEGLSEGEEIRKGKPASLLRLPLVPPVAMSSSQVLITKLEQQVLDEYSSIARNLDEVSLSVSSFLRDFMRPRTRLTRLGFSLAAKMSTAVQRLSAVQPHLLADLRPLERKLGLVFTLFKGMFTLSRASFERVAEAFRSS